MSTDALIFELDEIRFAISANEIHQILRAVAISPLPDAPSWMEGILNIRGQVVPLLDLRKLLHLPTKDLDVTDHLIVVSVDGQETAIRVDRAVDLVQLANESPVTGQAPVGGIACRGRVADTPLGLVHVISVDDLKSWTAAASEEVAFTPRSGGSG